MVERIVGARFGVFAMLGVILLLFGVLVSPIHAQTDTPDAVPITPENALELGETLTLNGHTFAITGMSYNDDDTLLATASADLSLRVWDMSEGVLLIEQFDHFATVSDVAFRPIEDVLLTASWDRSIKAYEWLDGALIPLPSMQGFQHIVEAVAFSADGTWYGFLVGDGSATLIQWADSDSRQLYTFDTLEMLDLAFAPEAQDGVQIAAVATGWPDLGVHLIASDGRDAVRLDHGHAGAVNALVFSPVTGDNWTLVTAGDDATLRVHALAPDLDNFETIATLEADSDVWFTDVAITPDGALLAAGTLEGDVMLYDLRDVAAPEQLSTIRRDDVSRITALTFNHAGTQLAVAGDDFRVHVFEINQ